MFLKKIAYSFHMPLFIMISGYLFYITRINKGSQYKKTLSDKFVRLGIPYVFFTVFAFFLKVYAGGVQRPVALSLKSFLCAFVWPFDGPLQEMWFVAVILIYFSLWGLAGTVDRKVSDTLFGSFRNYTYQIFLLGIFIQIGIKLLYDKLGMQGTYPYFYVLCVLSGIYIPVLISKVIQRVGNKYLNLLIGL